MKINQPEYIYRVVEHEDPGYFYLAIYETSCQNWELTHINTTVFSYDQYREFDSDVAHRRDVDAERRKMRKISETLEGACKTGQGK
jgi:hypothetical protein